MADVDITSLSVEISAESSGAELNIDKLATAISNLRTKGNVSKVIDGLDKLTNSLTALKSAQGDFSGLESVTRFIDGISKVNTSESAKGISTLAKSIAKLPESLTGMGALSDSVDTLLDVTDAFDLMATVQDPKGLKSAINAIKKIPEAVSGVQGISSDISDVKSVLNGFNNLPSVTAPEGLSSFVSLLRRIPKAVSEANKADYTQLAESSRQLMNGLAPLSVLDFSNLKNLGSVLNQLNKIPDLAQKLDSKTVGDFSTACQKLSAALTPLASQLDKVGNAFAKLPPQLSKVVTQANRVTAANERQKKSYLSLSNQMNGFMRNMAKLVSLKAIADYLGNAVAKFNDFYEAANMFGVSMGDMTNEASGFIDKMEQLLGIDPSEAMNAMANIYSMTKSFGLAKEQAYTLSKSLTQLGYDLSSLKNIPISQAFTKIRSAMAGELEPMLQLGVDISQARLQQELLALGFNKQVSTLSQADKATLRYIAILKQTTDAQGDFARTLSSPANMIRILKAQLSGLARDVGSLLYPAFKAILPVLIAAVELIREFVQWVAKLMGVKVVLTDFAKSADSVGGIGNAMDETTDSTKKAAKALKDYTMGFDELNIIDPTQGSSGSGSGASAGNILGDVDLSGYDMFKDYNEEFAKQIDAIKQKIKDMLPLIATVATALAAWKLTNLITDIVDAISKMNALKSIVLGLGVFTVGVVLEITGIKDAIENGVNGKNFAEIVLGALIGTTGAAILGKGIAQFIVTGFGSSAVGQAIKTAGGSTAGAIIGAAVGGIVTGIPMFVTGVYDAVKNGLNKLNGVLIPLGSTMTGAGIGAIIGSLGGPIGTGIGALIGLIVGAMTDVGIAIYQNWDKITSQLDKVSAEFKQWFVGVGEWWNEKWEGFKTNFQTAWESLPGFVQHPIQALDQASAGLKQWFVGVGEWWNQKWSGFKTNWDKSWNSLVDTIKNLPQKFLDYGKNIVEGLINGINNGVETAKKTVGGLAKAIIDKFTTDTEIHSPSKVFEQFGIYIDQGLANGITGSLGYVNDAMNKLVDATKVKGEEMASYGIDCGTSYVNGIISGLDSKWSELDNNLKTNFFGTVQTFIQAAQSGDWKTVGTTIAASIWGAMGDEQRKRVKSVASDLLGRLSKELKNQASSLLNTAATIGKNLVSALTQNFGKVSSETQTMLSGITQAFGNVKSPLATAAKAISAALSGGLLSSFPTIFAGFAGLVSTIGTAVAGMLSAVGAALSATVFGIPAGTVALAAAAALGVAIAGIVSKLGGSHSTSSYSDTSQYVGSSSYNSSTSSSSYSGTYSAASGNSEEMRDAVYNGCYNAFLDIWQRYGEEISDGRDVRVYLDSKQLTASVEKTQKERGVSIMGTEVYSY